MPKAICPHCGKTTHGSPRDEELYILVVCDQCETILGVIPKYYQKVTWKRREE